MLGFPCSLLPYEEECVVYLQRREYVKAVENEADCECDAMGKEEVV